MFRKKLKKEIYKKISVISKIFNFFIFKKNKILYLNISYYKLNNITIKN